MKCYIIQEKEKRSKTNIFAWIMLIALLVLMAGAPFALIVGWSMPMTIKRDQHYVNTINARAIEYEKQNGTVTDFTEAAIMSADAQAAYEERVFKLENRSTYWVPAWIISIIIAILMMFLWACILIIIIGETTWLD